MRLRSVSAIFRKDALDMWANRSTIVGLLFPSAAVAGPRLTRASSAEEVVAAFASGAQARGGGYAVGLVVPEGFDTAVRAGTHPWLHMYVDAARLKSTNQAALEATIADWGRAVAAVQPPVDLKVDTINAPASPSRNPFENLTPAVGIRLVYVPMALLLSLIVGITFVPQRRRCGC